MKNRFAVLSLTVVAACAVSVPAIADDAVPPKPPGGSNAPAEAPAPSPGGPQGAGRAAGGRLSPEERLKRLTEALNLTQDQQDKIKAIDEKYAPQFKELMSKGRESLTEEDKTKFRELMKTNFEEIATVLTPEQKEKFKELMEKRRAAGGAGGNGATTPGGAPK